MTNIIRKAQLYATKAHEGQFRSDGLPFISHPAKVVEILTAVTQDENVLAAAWLHDTIEDCGISREELAAEFNQDIADLVWELTKDKSHPDSEFPHLHSQRGITMKFADRLSNVSDMAGWPAERKQAYLDDSRFW